MSEQLINVLEELRRQWGAAYVISQETTATITEMQTHLEEMAGHANKMLIFAEVCACVGFVLAVFVASMLVWRWKYE